MMRRSFGVLTVAVVIGAPLPLYADAGDDAKRADAAFNAARALVDAGKYADACPKFAESKRLAPGVGVTLYLADCYEHVGRTASAWSEFRSAEGLARDRHDKRADVARTHAQSLEPKLVRLTIAIGATIPQSGLSVLRDGASVPRDEWNVAVPVDPGDHVVVVASPGRVSKTIATRVDATSPAATVRIDGLDPLAAPPVPSAAPSSSAAPPPSSSVSAHRDPPPIPPPSSPWTTRRWLAVGVGGVGVLGVGVGVVLGFLAKGRFDSSNGGPCNAANVCNADGLSQRQDALDLARASTIAFIAGGIAIAGGAAIYLTAPREAPRTGLVIAPTPLAGGGGAVLRGTF